MAYTQGTLLITLTALLATTGLWLTFNRKAGVALLVMLGLASLLRIFMAGDLYLHDWDERFHANVAKHIVDHPFVPVLYDDQVLDYEPNNWAEGSVWLSKPLLTFWVLGGSIAVFGANEFGLRLPSLVFGLLGVWLTFLLGRRLFTARVGLLAAFLHAVHGMLLRFGGGITSSDHVDQLFTLLFAGGVYSYVLYYDRRRKRYLLLTGTLIGLAFLTKWIMALFLGLIIAAIHLFVVLRLRDYLIDGGLISLTSFAVTAPWIIYLFAHYPTEINLVFGDFLERTDQVFEGHTGGPLFYLEQLVVQFRGVIYVPLVWLGLRIYRQRGTEQILLASWIFIPLVVLSFLTTKRGTYLMMSAPAYFLATALFLERLRAEFVTTKRQRRVVALSFILLLGLPLQYCLEQIKPFQTRFVKPAWRIALEERVEQDTANADKLIYHNHPRALDAMFYYDVQSYLRQLNATEIAAFETAGYKVVDYRRASD